MKHNCHDYTDKILNLSKNVICYLYESVGEYTSLYGQVFHIIQVYLILSTLYNLSLSSHLYKWIQIFAYKYISFKTYDFRKLIFKVSNYIT